jgi:hypothetical protein
MRAASKLGVALASSLLATTARARADLPDDRDHALPCRPTVACTADIVPPGTFEVEAGALAKRRRDLDRAWTLPLLLKQTFTKELQLQVGTNGYTVVRGPVSASYHDDITVGPKLHLLDQRELVPSVAVSAEASIPTLRRAGYVRTYDALFMGYVTKDLGPVHADFNAAFNLWRLEGPAEPQGLLTLALSTNLVPPFLAMVESYVFTNGTAVSPRDGGFLFALAQTPKPWLVLDEGGDIGFFPSTRTFSVFVGVTVIPAVLWR